MCGSLDVLLKKKNTKLNVKKKHKEKTTLKRAYLSYVIQFLELLSSTYDK